MKYTTQKLYDLPEGNVQEDAPRRVARKKKPRRKWLWFTLVVLLIMAGVAAAVLWDANSFDGLRRSIIYARAEKDETGIAKLYVCLQKSRICANTAQTNSIDGRKFRL